VPVQIHAQDSYIGGGVKFNYSPHVYGWHEKPFNVSFYYEDIHDPPKMSDFYFGFFAEFSKHRNLATVIDIDYGGRDYTFSVTDKRNNSPTETSGTIMMLSLAVSEKLKYGTGKFTFYSFATLRCDLNIIKSGYMDFLRQYAELHSFIPGMNLGVGISFGKKHRVSLDIHYDFDLRNHYESTTGNIKYKGYGITLGYGFFSAL